MITAALDSCGSRSLRMSKIVLIGYYPPSPPGVTNGTGSCGPGPAGAGGPGGNAGAKVDGGPGGPGGSRLSRRAPGGAFGRGARHPEYPAPVADRSDWAATRAHRAAPDTARWARTDPVPDRRPRTAAGCPVAGTSPAAAHTSTVSPAPQPVRGDPGCPRVPAVPVAGRRWRSVFHSGQAT